MKLKGRKSDPKSFIHSPMRKGKGKKNEVTYMYAPKDGKNLLNSFSPIARSFMFDGMFTFKISRLFSSHKKIQVMPLIKNSAFDHTYQENMPNSINISEMLFTRKSNRKHCYMTESKTNNTYDLTRNMVFVCLF